MSATPLKSWVRAAADLLYPRTCAGCDEPVRDGDRYLCWECRSSLPLIAHPFCSICGNPLEGRVDHGYICFLCAGERPHFDRARCASRFHGVLPKLAHDFKYHQAVWLQEDLAEVLEACWKTHYDGEQVDAVVPVPLFPARQRNRGYNQAALLAGALARHAEAGLPYISVLTNPTTAGVMASYATLGDLIIAEPNALIGFAGPRVIKETTQQDLPEGFQRSEFLLKHGLIDIVVSRKLLKVTLIQSLEYLMAGHKQA